MSQKQPYLPRADADKLAWLTNFSNKFTGYAATLGFTPSEATAITDDLTMFAYTL